MSSTTRPLSGRRDDGGTRAVLSSSLTVFLPLAKGLPCPRMEAKQRGGPQLAQGWAPRRSSKLETRRDSRALIFRSPAWVLAFARNRKQYAVIRTRRSIVPYRDGSMIAKRLGSCRLAQSVTTLFLSGDARRVSSSESAMVRRGHWEGSVRLRISCTRFATKGFHLRGSPWIQLRTIVLSLQQARHVERSHQFEPWEAQSLDRSDAGLGEAESHFLGPVHGLRHQVCHGAKRCFRGVATNVKFRVANLISWNDHQRAWDSDAVQGLQFSLPLTPHAIDVEGQLVIPMKILQPKRLEQLLRSNTNAFWNHTAPDGCLAWAWTSDDRCANSSANQASSIADPHQLKTSSGGRSINASGSFLAHFLRANPPVFISSVNLWTRCRASSTPSQLVARSSTYISDNTLSVSASMFPRRYAWCLTTCMARNGEHVRPNPTRTFTGAPQSLPCHRKRQTSRSSGRNLTCSLQRDPRSAEPEEHSDQVGLQLRSWVKTVV
ncbi:hypothetical protein T08_4881 [Trichinella sp. T8]|nr:hypothetical protein T08_4881 [Trichinella sp. T8]